MDRSPDEEEPGSEWSPDIFSVFSSYIPLDIIKDVIHSKTELIVLPDLSRKVKVPNGI